MPKIESGQFSSLVRRYLQMRGESFVLDELSPEISPVLVLEAERPEWQFLKGQKLNCCLIQTLPVAAQTSLFRLRNPAASGVFAIFEWIYFSTNSVATEVVFFRSTESGSDLANALGTHSRDLRWQPIGNNASALSASWANNIGASGLSFHRTFLAINAEREYRPAFILPPGFVFEIFTQAPNSDLRGSVNWLEKRLDDLEAR